MALASPLPFQSTLPYGSDESVLVNGIETLISIHAPLRERHDEIPGIDADVLISIHAPLRERLPCYGASYIQAQFQSTLPYGSDPYGQSFSSVGEHFNPRSLTGATCLRPASQGHGHISIHAPLRERPLLRARHSLISLFQSTLPYGSDLDYQNNHHPRFQISIHAPLRERRKNRINERRLLKFQSTLPYGSDGINIVYTIVSYHFNPRSLTGATRCLHGFCRDSTHFNPRSLTGATGTTR